MAGSTNVQGEDVKKLDVLSNELFVNMLASSYTVHMMVSEENETVIEVICNSNTMYNDIGLLSRLEVLIRGKTRIVSLFVWFVDVYIPRFTIT